MVLAHPLAENPGPPAHQRGQLAGLGPYHCQPGRLPFAENTRFNGIMLVNPGAFPQKASVCPLSGGDEVNFYQLLPLYQEEMDFKLSHSAGELLDLFPEEDLETVDVDRPSVLSDRPQKEFAIPQQELRHLYDGEGPQGCFATDRILVDGCRVGYCYREEPEEGTRIGIAAGASPPEMRATAIWTTRPQRHLSPQHPVQLRPGHHPSAGLRTRHRLVPGPERSVPSGAVSA